MKTVTSRRREPNLKVDKSFCEFVVLVKGGGGEAVKTSVFFSELMRVMAVSFLGHLLLHLAVPSAPRASLCQALSRAMGEWVRSALSSRGEASLLAYIKWREIVMRGD